MRCYRVILIIFSLFLFSINLSALSQTEHINCMIFINGKLPLGSWIMDEYFSYSDSTGGLHKIDFYYVTGEIQLTQKNANILHFEY